MFRQIAEFYGLYLERDLGAKMMVLGDYNGNWKHVNLVSIEAFRAECENFMCNKSLAVAAKTIN